MVKKKKNKKIVSSFVVSIVILLRLLKDEFGFIGQLAHITIWSVNVFLFFFLFYGIDDGLSVYMPNGLHNGFNVEPTGIIK